MPPRDGATDEVKRSVDSALPDPQCRQDNPGRRSWQIALPNACKDKPAPIDVRRIEVIFRRERSDQSFVGSHVFQNAAQETGLARGRANLLRSNTGYGKKASEPFCVAADERKRLNRKRFSLFSRECRAAFHRLICLPIGIAESKAHSCCNPLRSAP